MHRDQDGNFLFSARELCPSRIGPVIVLSANDWAYPGRAMLAGRVQEITVCGDV